MCLSSETETNITNPMEDAEVMVVDANPITNSYTTKISKAMITVRSVNLREMIKIIMAKSNECLFHIRQISKASNAQARSIERSRGKEEPLEEVLDKECTMAAAAKLKIS